MKRLHLALAVFLTLFTLLPALPVSAVSGNQFDPGRIIDDNVFFNSGAMSEQNIADFLNSKVTNCDTNGTQIYSGSTTRAAYSATKGYSAPFTCLKDYRANITSQAADAYCSAVSAETNVTSAHMIYQVSQKCGINPQVMLVLLQKEQALVTDDWPWPTQYQKATGFGCPDTAACDTTYSGLFNQVYYAARQFRKYQANPSVFSFAGGRTSYVQFNPNAGCLSSSVSMQTNATADLYNYTPYQPNTAALNNMYGSGDGCSAYGNRNFWRYFNDWFGPTTSNNDTNVISFIKLNDASGNAQDVGYSSISQYTFAARSTYTGYPKVTPDGAVIPLYNPSGDLSFIRLNHSSGRVELITYSAVSNFKQLVNYSLTSYPKVTPDGAVIPLYKPNGDLSFVRLNHSSGHVEIVTYSASSNFQQLVGYSLSGYPKVTPDGAVVPLYNQNGDLSFVRLNHSSGHVEVVTYSASSNYAQLSGYALSSYPAVAPDGAVVPLYKPNGDLSFVRLNHGSGNVEIVSYSASSNFQQLSDYALTGYPAVTPDHSIIPLYTR